MTTLAEVNATLGVTNLALSGVAKEQKETNKGISKFVDFMLEKDTRDRREDIETKTEKKASVISRVGVAGGYALGAGKKGLDLGKGLFGGLGKILPIGLAGAFLTSLFGSKLFRGGIAGLGFMFGDQIAEMLTGPDAKKEVKDMLGGAIKGGALGFLLGPKFGAIGFILGGLLKNDTVDEEAGRLLDNLDKLGIQFPKLSGIFTGIANAVGGGLKSINNLIEGTSEDKAGDIGKAMLLVGGVATLLMPGKMAGLVLALSKRLLTTPAGLAIMAIAGSGAAINMLMGNEVDDPSGFIGSAATAATGYGLYKGMKMKNAAPGVSGKAVSRLSKGAIPNAGGQSSLAKMFGLLKTGAKRAFGLMTSATGAAILVPLAAVGITEALFGDDMRAENEENKQKQNALKSSVKTNKVGKEFFTGTAGYMDDTIGANTLTKFKPNEYLKGVGIESDTSDLKNFFSNSLRLKKLAKESSIDGGIYAAATAKKNTAISGVRNQFEANQNVGGTTTSNMDPTGNAGDLNMVNSNNRTVTTNNNAGVVLDNAGAIDRQDNLSNQIKNPSNLF